MSVIGFNSGMSDALQKIMEQRVKQKQQDFENNLKLQEAQQKAEQHAADLRFKEEQLQSAKAARAEVTGEKLSKDVGAGSDINRAQADVLTAGNQPISGGKTLPSTSSIGFGTLPTLNHQDFVDENGVSPSPPDTSVTPPPPTPVSITPMPSGGSVASSSTLGAMLTKPMPSIDQLASPPEKYNPETGSGAQVPIQNVGTFADRQALAQRKGWVELGTQMWGDDSESKQLFGKLMANGMDPKNAIDAVKAIKDKGPAGGVPTQAEGLFSPATHNAVIFDPRGPQGAGYYDAATHAFVPAPSHYQSGDPAVRALSMELAQQRLKGAQELAAAPEAIYNAIRAGDEPASTGGLARAGTWALVMKLAGEKAAEDRAAGRVPFNLKDAMIQWQGALRLTQSLNSPQQASLSQSIISTDHALTLIDNLAQQWDSSGLGPFSRARLELAKQGAGDFGSMPPDKRLAAQSLANRLSAEINDVTLNLGSVYGRGTPTDATRELAAQNIRDWWSKGTVHDLVDQSRWNLNNISQAMRTNTVNTGGGPSAAPALPVPTPVPGSPDASSVVTPIPPGVTFTRTK